MTPSHAIGWSNSSVRKRSRPATSTDGTSATSRRRTSKATVTVTSSPASEAGRERFRLLAGQPVEKYGPDLVRASLSARQASVAGLMTSGTYGQRSSISSRSADLTSSLANRLPAGLACYGSTLFTLTWKVRATPSGRQISALRASALPTSDSGSGGSAWPTPAVPNGGRVTPEAHVISGKRDNGNKVQRTLESISRLATWATPQARDVKGSRTGETLYTHNARPLNEQVAMLVSTWSTPTAMDGRRGSLPPRPQDTGHPLSQQVAGLGPTLSGSPAETGKPGQLNPAFSLWLMGYPHAWVCCGAQVTRSSRKLVQRS